MLQTTLLHSFRNDFALFFCRLRSIHSRNCVVSFHLLSSFSASLFVLLRSTNVHATHTAYTEASQSRQATKKPARKVERMEWFPHENCYSYALNNSYARFWCVWSFVRFRCIHSQHWNVITSKRGEMRKFCRWKVFANHHYQHWAQKGGDSSRQICIRLTHQINCIH